VAVAAVATAAPPSPVELQEQLNAAIATGAGSFTIPPGDYNFSNVGNFDIHNAHRLKVIADGVTMWFNGTHRPTTGVNITNCDTLFVRGLSINYPTMQVARFGIPGITYNLLNCTNVTSENITIYKAPFFSVTAFNGGGGHVFRRFNLPANHEVCGEANCPKDPSQPKYRWPHQRDAFHFTDLRQGVVVEDSIAGHFGDDFFNSHNTLMVVLKQESPTSLLIINPHLQNVETGRNTVYGTNCVLENLRARDEMHFYKFPDYKVTYIPTALSDTCVVKGAPDQVSDAATLANAAALAKVMAANFSTVEFDATDVWRVTFAAPVPSNVVEGSLVNIDSFSTPGTIIRNNTFNQTKYNLGRFKSNGGAIVNNTFYSGSENLEITPLLQYFEGNLPYVRDVVVAGNTIVGQGVYPFHCSPFCNSKCKAGTCAACSDCSQDSAWAHNISVHDNRLLNSTT